MVMVRVCAIESAGRSDRGRVRSDNQDAFGSFPELGLFIVADGMGGPRGGWAAGRAAVEIIRAAVAAAMGGGGKPGEILVAAIKSANDRIHRMGSGEKVAGMGTTVAAVLVDGAKLHIAHVGDTRVYRIRGGDAVQFTRDHGVADELRAAGIITGDVPRRWPLRHFLSRALGPKPEVEVDYRSEIANSGDVVIICTDGVHGCLSESDLTACARGLDSASEVCLDLLDRASEKGGRDNATAIVLKWRQPAG